MKKIPVYNIHTISCKTSKIGLLEILPFEEHLINSKNIHFPHRHDFYYLLYITKGKGTHTIDFKTYPLKDHQLFFMSPGQVHQWDIKPNTKGYTLFFSKELYSTSDFKIEYEWSFFHNFFDDAAFSIPKNQQAPITELFSLILKEYSSKKNYQEKITKNLTAALLYKINELLISEKKVSNVHSLDVIRKFDLLIDKHFITEHQIDFYANSLTISPNYLNALCKKSIGKSAKELMNQRLLLEAKRLLTHSTLSINDISDYLNFNSSSYFVRFFKKQEKITPQQFKIQKS